MVKAQTKRVEPDAVPVRAGILPSQAIRSMIEAGHLRPARPDVPIQSEQIQPASLDLRLGPGAYRVRASFLPGERTRVGERLEEFKLHDFEFGPNGKVLEVGCVYLIPLLERLALPADVSATANPKSSTGRLDVFTRVVADGVTAFDQLPAGFKGELWLEVCPQSFPIVVREGSRLSQIRFRIGDPRESDAELAKLQARESLVSGGAADIFGGIALSVDLSPDAKGPLKGLMGYRAKRNTGVVDVDAPGAYAIADYWEPISVERSHNRLILDPDQFYILASKEAVHIPPTHAAEMMPYNPLVGEFRVHYAGFMDPGFGHAAAGGKGSRVVLEVRSHKVPFILEDGQTIGRLVYERMAEVPDQLYGSGLGSHYQAQGLKLSKHFR